MLKSKRKTNCLMALAIICIMLLGALLPISQATNIDRIKGFDKGPSYKSVVPMKKVTFVNFDEESYLDDYAYLAAVPTAVFNDENKLFSNPLLFYQDEYPVEDDKERSLNARQGIDYFMEDWMSYSGGTLDSLMTINVPKNKLDSSWKAKDYVTIEGDNPYEIAKEIALQEWSYSENAVIAVIDEDFKTTIEKTTGTIKDTLKIDKKVITDHFEVEQTNSLNPVSHDFTVPDGYMYVYARCWYPAVNVRISLPVPGFEMSAKMAIPPGDKDLQLYCMQNGEWMQVLAWDAWNQKGGMDKERGGSYVYNTGKWRASVTDVPTKKIIKIENKYGSWLDILKSIRQVIYQVDVEMYPGIRVPLFDNISYGCKNVKIKLECKNSDVNLGFCLIGPSGEEISSDIDGEINVGQLGELNPGESYDVAIYKVLIIDKYAIKEKDVVGSFDYEITYSWEQEKTHNKRDFLTDATEGAVIASNLNAPLLYTSSSKLPQATIDALYKLGVKNIYLVNVGNHLSKDARDDLKEIAKIKQDYIIHKDIYDYICGQTGSNDVIFSTIESWKPWLVYERKATNEIPMQNALFLGPAAYLAAHHGSPVLIVDNHPELSTAVAWHNEYWNKVSFAPIQTPNVAEMYLTGNRVYDFLRDNGFDKDGRETIITVAGQFNIGAAWDRVFIGVANSGRFFGSPVDTAYWISRSTFYPALIFVNPATDPQGVVVENGSVSHRRTFLPWGKGGLKIDKPSQEETVKYPVVMTFLHYEHRFNERASKYYGSKYHCADGLIPGESYTFNAIDQGVSAYIEQEGSLFPDMSMSDVLPAYLSKGGFGNVFATSFPAVVKDVNNGVLLWMHFAHGFHADGGTTQYWENKNDPNPWRMYEFYLGSTEEPDTLTIDINGIIPALLGNPDPELSYIFRTALDWAPAKKPILDKISFILSKIPIIKKITPEWLLDTQDYYDGLINTVLLSKLGCTIVTGPQIDDEVGNLHSAGYITNACLMATKYIHLALIRHGTVFQIMDPWPTSWYSAVWAQSVPRDIIAGDTVGEAFTKGISHVGILHLTDPPQWWWDNAENVCYYGDPDLRLYVPSTQYSDANNWETEDARPLRYSSELNINGHMPFGATAYPHAKEPQTFLEKYIWFIVIFTIIVIFVLAMVSVRLKGSKKK